MLLKSLALKNFRNYGHLNIDVHPSFNIFVGENGSGKSNLLEAIAYLYLGKSFRTSFQKALIKSEASLAYIQAHFSKDNVDHRIQIQLDSSQKLYIWNQSRYKSFKPLVGLLCGVSLSPDDQLLIKGVPEKRRLFIDQLLYQCDPLYFYYTGRYAKALRQRNALLKTPHKLTASLLSPFESQMSHAAAYMHHQRFKMVKNLQDKMLVNTASILPSVAADISQLELKYRSSNQDIDTIDIKGKQQAYQEMYLSSRPQDIQQRSTLIGPHRDDIEILSGSMLAKHFCSEGQIRGIIAALKVAEWDLLFEKTGYPPFSLVDDLGAFLDYKRQLELVQLLSKRGQLFITSTSLPEWVNQMDGGCSFVVSAGAILSAVNVGVRI